MKKHYLLLLVICMVSFTQAQIVNIPDANFKVLLVNSNIADFNNEGTFSGVVDTNSDGEIQESEAAVVTGLSFGGNNINSLEGIEYFTSLEYLTCTNNNLVNLDLSANTSLYKVWCKDNNLNIINVNGCTSLFQLWCSNNNLINLDVSTNVNLDALICESNNFTDLDLSSNINLTYLACHSNNLNTLNLKNGGSIQGANSLYFYSNPNLAYICIDEEELTQVQNLVDSYGYTNCAVNTYCTFTPGGDFYEVTGKARLDANINGCDVEDSYYSYLQYNITDGTTATTYITNTLGEYYFPVEAGSYTITPQVENPTYFNVSPTSLVVSFPTNTSPYIQDFCITPNGVYNDLEIVLLPINQASPGFEAEFQLVYKNKGNTILSGSAAFSFNDDLMDFVSAIPIEDVQNTGSLTWNYTNLQPYETRIIEFTMNINTPTDPSFPVNNGDILDFTATINPVVGDETPDDNVFELHQTVVNSYDPNDKTCLEGKTISPSEVGRYVHYMIRFENNGTANAVNIVVKDVIDTAMYAVSTLIPLHGSHEYVTRIKNTNEVEFIFENINLPFDDANNDGFVAFKIKTLPTLVENDTFENKAEIYFDYNFPIITDKEITTIMNPLSISDYKLDSSLKIYPNPANDFIKISGNNNLKNISLYDINGRLLQEVKILGNQMEKELSLHQLASGIYLIKIQSDKGVLLDKVIKK
ncbi:MAG: T9SS type A sorting domain-containing protein [Flavobacteriaceae bacterium]|nr:T9SS type A sorting domain-containing protein [Flavobacteriaceae bacterium]